MARVLVLVSDLMLGSKVTETLRSAGHEVVGSDPREPGSDPSGFREPGSDPSGFREPGSDLSDFDLIVADLDAVDVEAIAAASPPKLGFCRHTDVEARRAAERAGFDLVVPRSRMARELPQLASGLLGA